jgi:hypothetical protein
MADHEADRRKQPHPDAGVAKESQAELRKVPPVANQRRPLQGMHEKENSK